MKISVCIIANKLFTRMNETLMSYKSCDEVLVGYNGTEEELAAFSLPDLPNLRLIRQRWQGYGPTKNELASMAANDWILSVDSDEVADCELQENLGKFSPAGVNEIYLLEMRHCLGNKQIRYGSWGKGKTRFERLYNRQHTAWDEADVHEAIIIKNDSCLVALDGLIKHYTAETIEQFEAKNEYYARLSAIKYYNNGRKGTLLKRFFSPVFTFLKQYFFQLGFMDGKAGFLIAKGNANYTFRKYELLHKLRLGHRIS